MINQINIYRNFEGVPGGPGVSRLNENAKLALYKDTTDNPIKTARVAFVNYLKAHKSPKKDIVDGLYADPIDAETFLGKEGLKLYQAALQEEMNSREYRDAVFNQATKFISGQQLLKRPTIIIAGPSACGKSSASEKVIDKLKEMPRKPGVDSGTYIACVDNGISREVSQMRKLVIRAANMNGYQGISDLHEKSKVLENAKRYVYDSAMLDEKFGLLIPETYARLGFVTGLSLVVSRLLSYVSSDLARDLTTASVLFSRFVSWFLSLIIPTVMQESLPVLADRQFIQTHHSADRDVIFVHIKGAVEGDFESLVNYNAQDRAWLKVYKVEHGARTFDTLDLNDTTDLTESKAHQGVAFYPGVKGSEIAFELFASVVGDNPLYIEIVNDVILLKKTEAQEETWEQAERSDTGCSRISKRIFEEWNAAKANNQLLEDELSLTAYAVRRMIPPNYSEEITRRCQIQLIEQRYEQDFLNEIIRGKDLNLKREGYCNLFEESEQTIASPEAVAKGNPLSPL